MPLIARFNLPGLFAAMLLSAAGIAHAQATSNDDKAAAAPQVGTPPGKTQEAGGDVAATVVVLGEAPAKNAKPAGRDPNTPGFCDAHPLEKKDRLEGLTIIQRSPSAVERATMDDRRSLERGCR